MIRPDADPGLPDVDLFAEIEAVDGKAIVMHGLGAKTFVLRVHGESGGAAIVLARRQARRLVTILEAAIRILRELDRPQDPTTRPET